RGGRFARRRERRAQRTSPECSGFQQPQQPPIDGGLLWRSAPPRGRAPPGGGLSIRLNLRSTLAARTLGRSKGRVNGTHVRLQDLLHVPCLGRARGALPSAAPGTQPV